MKLISKAGYFLALCRPRQWFKSFYIIFGAVPEILLMPPDFVLALWLLFLGVSNMIIMQGVIYTINDISDADNDRMHPLKRKRPIASGSISKRGGLVFAFVLLSVALLQAFSLDIRIALIDIAILFINMIYSLKPFRLKDRRFIDVFSAAANFPLRVLVVWFLFEPYSKASSFLGVSFASIMIFTYFMACFLLSQKRLAEKIVEGGIVSSRSVLKKYNTAHLKTISFLSGIAAIASFALFMLSLKFIYVIMAPFLFLLMLWYYKMAFEENSIVRSPEDIFTKRPRFVLSALLLMLAFVLLMFM